MSYKGYAILSIPSAVFLGIGVLLTLFLLFMKGGGEGLLTPVHMLAAPQVDQALLQNGHTGDFAPETALGQVAFIASTSVTVATVASFSMVIAHRTAIQAYPAVTLFCVMLLDAVPLARYHHLWQQLPDGAVDVTLTGLGLVDAGSHQLSLACRGYSVQTPEQVSVIEVDSQGLIALISESAS